MVPSECHLFPLSWMQTMSSLSCFKPSLLKTFPTSQCRNPPLLPVLATRTPSSLTIVSSKLSLRVSQMGADNLEELMCSGLGNNHVDRSKQWEMLRHSSNTQAPPYCRSSPVHPMPHRRPWVTGLACGHQALQAGSRGKVQLC